MYKRLILTSSFLSFLASDPPEAGELALRVSLMLLVCEAEPGLLAEDDLSLGEREVR